MENLDEKEIAAKIEMMLSIVTSFTEVVATENNALKSGDIKKVKSIYEQKIKTVAAYRSLCAYFIKNRDIIKEYHSDAKENLQQASAKLDEELKQNEMLLKTRMEAAKTVMSTFINIAKKTNAAKASSYGARGAYTPLANSHNALAFNRTM